MILQTAEPTVMSLEVITLISAIIIAGLLLVWSRAPARLAQRSKAESKEAVLAADVAVAKGKTQVELLARLGEELGELTLKVSSMQIELDNKNKTTAHLTSEVNQLRAQVTILVEREQALASENMRLQAQLEARQS